MLSSEIWPQTKIQHWTEELKTLRTKDICGYAVTRGANVLKVVVRACYRACFVAHVFIFGANFFSGRPA